MSIRITSTQHASRSEAPNGGASFSLVMWVRRDVDTGAAAYMFRRHAGSFFQQDACLLEADDSINAIHGSSISGTLLNETTGNWRYLLLHYQGETTPGSSADGVLTLKYLNDGDSSFQGTVTISSVSNLTPDRIIFGAGNTSDGDPWDGTLAFAKLFTSVLSDADALTEREYRHAQTNSGTLWAEYTFDSGALDSDTSGNSRTLTLSGTPTYSSDEPTAILGDDPAGGGTTTLTADSGTFGLTGADASLEYNRRLSAEAGSFALTGTDASLEYNSIVTGSPGVYELTGGDANLLYNRLVAADGGSFALTGGNASLEHNRRLAADPGTFSLTGTDATLTYNGSATVFTLTADGGSFALTGTAASLLHNRSLTAAAGDYALTGTDAALLYHRVLAAAGGSFALTGTDADLLRAYMLTASGGAFALTGTDATLLLHRVLSAEGGTFSLTGADVTLTANTELFVAPRHALGPDTVVRHLGADTTYRHLGSD